MKKWNYKTKKHENYTVPDNWKVELYSTNIFKKINCAACGKSMIYGYGFMSRTIRDRNGFSYTICKDCHNKEIKEEEEYICKSLNEAMGWPKKENFKKCGLEVKIKKS